MNVVVLAGVGKANETAFLAPKSAVQVVHFGLNFFAAAVIQRALGIDVHSKACFPGEVPGQPVNAILFVPAEDQKLLQIQDVDADLGQVWNYIPDITAGMEAGFHTELMDQFELRGVARPKEPPPDIRPDE
jgi:hypothetical protein